MTATAESTLTETVDSSKPSVAHPLASMTTQPQNSPGWARRRHITTTLASGEILTPLSLMTEDGHWVNMRNALISPYYNTSGISESAAAMMEYRQQELTGEEVRTFVTPLGTITNRRAVVLWFELSQLPLPPILMRLPLLERVGNLEVDMVLGLPFYTWYVNVFANSLLLRPDVCSRDAWTDDSTQVLSATKSLGVRSRKYGYKQPRLAGRWARCYAAPPR